MSALELVCGMKRARARVCGCGWGGGGCYSVDVEEENRGGGRGSVARHEVGVPLGSRARERGVDGNKMKKRRGGGKGLTVITRHSTGTAVLCIAPLLCRSRCVDAEMRVLLKITETIPHSGTKF